MRGKTNKLQEYLDSCVEELEDWRSRYTQLEKQKSQEISQLIGQFEDTKRADFVRD